MFKEFKEFISKSNVFDLAVAVILGSAFFSLITTLTGAVLMPLIGALGAKKNLDEYFWTVRKSEIRWGTFLTSSINFLIVALALFILIKAMATIRERRANAIAPEPPAQSEIDLLTEIRDLLLARNDLEW